MPTAKLTYTQLAKKAKEKGILYHGKTRAQLEIDLKVEDPDIFVIDRAAEYSREELLDLKKDNQVIPGKTIAYKKDRDIIEEYFAHNPMAFNNCDLTDTKNHTQHIFGTKDVVCHCGEKFRIERKYGKRIGAGSGPGAVGEAKKIMIEETTTRHCPNCGRKWIYHDMQTAKAASGKYVNDV